MSLVLHLLVCLYLLSYQISRKAQTVPAIPLKTWFKSLDPIFIEQRRVELDSYLKKLINLRVVLTTVEFKNFLELPHHVPGVCGMVCIMY